MTNPAIYEQLKDEASGLLKGEAGTYTSTQFLAAFPEFTDANHTSLIPSTVLNTFVNMANDTISPTVWGTAYEYAAGLFVAHKCALRAQTYATSNTLAGLAGNSQQSGIVKSATMGDTSISYDNAGVTSGTEKWGTWNSTKYGAELATMARSIGITGSFVV